MDRGLRFASLKVGDVFQYRHKDKEKGWYECVYVMLYPSVNANGQAFNLSTGEFTWFAPSDSNVLFRVFGKLTVAGPRYKEEGNIISC